MVNMPLQEFNTIEAAQALMESDARDSVSINGRPLTLDYSISQYGSRDAQAGNLADWICTMCQAVNFARQVITTAKHCMHSKRLYGANIPLPCCIQISV